MKKKLVCGVMAGMLALSASLSSCDVGSAISDGYYAVTGGIQKAFTAVCSAIGNVVYPAWQSFRTWFFQSSYDSNLEGIETEDYAIRSLLEQWELTVPEEATMEYRLAYSRDITFTECTFYTVFDFSACSTQTIAEWTANYSKELNEEFNTEFNSLLVYLEEKREQTIPQSCLPDFEAEYYWQYLSETYNNGKLKKELHAVYSPATQLWYVIEEGHSYR